MAKRGAPLREHILFTAKEVFIELGFERATMDVLAARAGTTKRTLYAHFENKEKLFLAVIELVRGLFLGKLRMPAEYAEDPREALVLFCGRFLEILLWGRMVRLCRLNIAEAVRLPQGAARLYEGLFDTAQERLEVFLRGHLGHPPERSGQVAHALLSGLIHPRFTRALFGLETGSEDWLTDAISPDFDLAPVRRAVAAIVPPTSHFPLPTSHFLSPASSPASPSA